MKKVRLAELVNMARSLVSSKSLTKLHTDYGAKRIHYSFIWRDGHLLSVGTNRLISVNDVGTQLRRFYGKPHMFMHSELDAVRRCPIDAREATMVNVCLNRRGDVRCARPCQSCLELLIALNFQKVYFTTPTGDFSCITL